MKRTVSGKVVLISMGLIAAACALAYVLTPWPGLRDAVDAALKSAPTTTPGAPGAIPALPTFPMHTMEPAVRRQFHEAIARLGAGPGSAADNAALGMLYHAYRLPALAQACYSRAVALDGGTWQYRYLLGVARFDEGRAESAVEEFDRVLAARPAEKPVMLYRAEALRRLGRFEVALQGFTAVVEADPDNARALYGAAQIELRLGRAQRAEALLREALRLQPRYGPARYALGQALRQQGQLDEAQTHLSLAERQPAEPPADEELDKQLTALRSGAVESLHRGIELFSEGNNEQAIPLFEQAIRTNPDLAEAHGQLGAALLAQGREQEAQAALLHAVDLDPGFADAQYHLGLLAHRQGRFDEAVSRFEEAVAIRPGYFEAHLALGADLPQLGRADGAVAHLRQAAAALRPDDAKHAKQLAKLLAEMGLGPEAVSVLRACNRRLPEDASVADRLAWMLATSADATVRDPAEALRLADDACRRTRGQEPLAQATLAAALAAQGRYDEAAEVAKAAQALAAQRQKADLAADIGRHLEAYRAQRPWIEPSGPQE